MNTNTNHRKLQSGGDSGWTYVETLIVIGIVIILSGTVGFIGMRYVEKAREITAGCEIENLGMALNSYYLDCLAYPSEEQGLEALWEKPVTEPVPEGWNGPYLTKPDFTDPWGNGYDYRIPGPHGLPYGLVSFGSDGIEGGEGSAKDLLSWE